MKQKPYTQIEFQTGIKSVKVKNNSKIIYANEFLVLCEIFPYTWAVCNRQTKYVIALFFRKPNQHGFDIAKEHAKTYMICQENFNPFELDLVS